MLLTRPTQREGRWWWAKWLARGSWAPRRAWRPSPRGSDRLFTARQDLIVATRGTVRSCLARQSDADLRHRLVGDGEVNLALSVGDLARSRLATVGLAFARERKPLEAGKRPNPSKFLVSSAKGKRIMLMQKRALASTSSGQPSQLKRPRTAPMSRVWHQSKRNLMPRSWLTKEDVRTVVREEWEHAKSDLAEYFQSSMENALKEIMQQISSTKNAVPKQCAVSHFGPRPTPPTRRQLPPPPDARVAPVAPVRRRHDHASSSVARPPPVAGDPASSVAAANRPPPAFASAGYRQRATAPAVAVHPTPSASLSLSSSLGLSLPLGGQGLPG
ncbi:hypothetical protein NL676_007941 [Syzygium grande]|nr:hypothetical protein NL676_007941 [Syzygium grande]